MIFPYLSAQPARSLIAIILPLALLAGCDEATLKSAPDASPTCAAPLAEFPCVAQAPGATGCTGDFPAMTAFGLNADVFVDASYPLGCTVQVNDPVPDQDNACTQDGTCQCYDDGGPFHWVCWQ